MKNPLSHNLQQGGDVLQQSWPAVDPKYLDVPDFVELSVRVGSHKISHTLILCWIFVIFFYCCVDFHNLSASVHETQQDWRNVVTQIKTKLFYLLTLHMNVKSFYSEASF